MQEDARYNANQEINDLEKKLRTQEYKQKKKAEEYEKKLKIVEKALDVKKEIIDRLYGNRQLSV